MASILNAPSLATFLKKKYQRGTHIIKDLVSLIEAFAAVGTKVQREVVLESFASKVAAMQCYNASGDEQYPSDITTHNHIVSNLNVLGIVCAILSEEEKNPILLHNNGNYIVALDPIDGSKNLIINGPAGTIFSVYQRISPTTATITKSDLLQPGNHQVAAGYLLYGITTLFICSLGDGVHLFTYDPSSNQFLLTNPAVTIPKKGIFYANNDGFLNTFPEYVQDYILRCRREGLSARYFGALVADFHQILINGGIYMYPTTHKHPEGKLRLLFECNPLAFIAKQAKGSAMSGRKEATLNIKPVNIHQQVPFYIGSPYMVQGLIGKNEII